jgi:hypothetical protein
MAFLTWLSGKQSQSELDGLAGRSFRHATAWCWDIEPTLGKVTTTHHQVLVDGIWVGSWCLLIAVTERLEVPAPLENEPGDEDTTPGPYDTGLSVEEGYWARSGWAGRS